MTAEAAAEQIIVDDVQDWRCSACPVRPKLARFGRVGGVHIHIAGRPHTARNYLIDITHNSIKAHCPACHSWRELYWDEARQMMAERAWTGSVPLVGCSCEFERFAQSVARRREEQDHGTTTGTEAAEAAG